MTTLTQTLVFIGTYILFSGICYWIIFGRDRHEGKYVLKVYMNDEGLNNVKHIASMLGKSDVETLRHALGLLQMVIDTQTESGEVVFHPKDEEPFSLPNLVFSENGEDWKS